MVLAGTGVASFLGDIGVVNIKSLADLDVTAGTMRLKSSQIKVDDTGGSTITFAGAVQLLSDVSLNTNRSQNGSNVTFLGAATTIDTD